MESANITNKGSHVVRDANMDIIIKNGTMKLDNKTTKPNMTIKKANTIKSGIKIKKERNSGDKTKIKKLKNLNRLQRLNRKKNRLLRTISIISKIKNRINGKIRKTGKEKIKNIRKKNLELNRNNNK